jgi:hypothetical protein
MKASERALGEEQELKELYMFQRYQTVEAGRNERFGFRCHDQRD